MGTTGFLNKVRVTWAVFTLAVKAGYKKKNEWFRKRNSAPRQPRHTAGTQDGRATNSNNNTNTDTKTPADRDSEAVNSTRGTRQAQDVSYSRFGQVPIPARSPPCNTTAASVSDTVAVRGVAAACQPVRTHAATQEQDDAPARALELSFATQFYAVHTRRSPVCDDGVLLQACKVRGDGRCLFRSVVRSLRLQAGLFADAGCSVRSVCDTLGISASRPRRNGRAGESRRADLLRFMVVDLMRQHESLFTNFSVLETRRSFATYLDQMSKPRTFGGEPEILTIAKLLQTPVLVYVRRVRGGRVSFERIMAYGEEHYLGTPVRLLYLPHIPHYDALVALNDAE